MRGALVQWLGVRHFRLNLLRTAITTLGISVGVAMVVAISALNNGLLRSFQHMMDRVTNGVDLVVGGNGQHVDEGALDTILAVPEVEHASGMMDLVVTVPALKERLLVLGVDLLNQTPVMGLKGQSSDDTHVLEDPIAFLNSAENVLLASTFATRHGLKRGDDLTIIAPSGTQKVHVYGVLKDEGMADAFGGSVAVASIDVAQLWKDRPGQYSRIDISLKEGTHVDAAARTIEHALGGKWAVRKPAQMGSMGGELSAVFRRGLQMSSFVALLVSLCIIYNTMLISVLQRRRELGVLRAVGAAGSDVTRLIVSEALLMGIVGSVTGVLVGLVMARVAMQGAAVLFSSMFLPIERESARLAWTQCLAAVSVGTVSTVLAAWAPAHQAGRTSPIEALTTSLVTAAPILHARARLLGMVAVLAVAFAIPALPLDPDDTVAASLFCAALVFVAVFLVTPLMLVAGHRMLVRPAQALLGFTGRLSVDNMVRTLRRGSANVAGLAAAVLTVVALAGYIESFLQSLTSWISQVIVADIIVVATPDAMAADDSHMQPDVVDKLRAVDGVEDVVAVRAGNQDQHGKLVRIRAVDGKGWLRHVKFPVLDGALGDAVEEGSIFISETMAHTFALHAGDTFTLDTPSGPLPVRVQAVVVDYGATIPVVTMDRALYVEHFRDPLLSAAEVFLKPGVVDADVRQRIMALPDGIWASSNASFKKRIDEAMAGFFGLTRLLVLLALFVAVLGIVNTLQADVLDRIREMGLLRAVGASRQQVLNTVVLQGVMMTFVATVLGVLAGVVMGGGMVRSLMQAQTGWRLPFVVPWAAVIICLAGAPVAAALAAWWPARNASRMDVRDALARE